MFLKKQKKIRKLWQHRVEDSSGTTTTTAKHHSPSQDSGLQTRGHSQPYTIVPLRTSTGTTTTTTMMTSSYDSICVPNIDGDGAGDDEDQTMISSTGSGSKSRSLRRSSIMFGNCCGGGRSSGGGRGEKKDPHFEALVAKLTEAQISTLCRVVENRGTIDGFLTNCVLVPREVIMDVDPNVIACRIWRWSDVRSSAELKRIPSCPNDPVYVCCNPYHWSRLCFVGGGPPPYHPIDMECQTTEDPPLNESISEQKSGIVESMPTDGEDSANRPGWCQLAYWELTQRIGDKFPVENSAVNVFFDQPRGDGMCLKILSDQRKSETPDAVYRARKKIGLGVTLSKETDSVWLYNRSSEPIFIYSPTLNANNGGFHVSRVQPGYCLKAYNYMALSQTLVRPLKAAQRGPVDTFSMRISFGKGFGQGYSRQDVTRCPCWLEVLLEHR